jgi:TetR/AcrR family transcriptional regulator, tetracycline repressor protein
MARPSGEGLLTRERIVGAALRVIDEFGLDALSMRRLGSQLGVDPMSIYHHIPNKEALLRAVVHDVFATMRVPPSTGRWQQRVRGWANAYRDVARAHPNLALQIVSDPAGVAIAAIQANEALYAALDASGLPAKAVIRAADLIVDYVNGSVLPDASGSSDRADAAAAFWAELHSRPPEQTAVQRRLLTDSAIVDDRDSFGFGLDVILAGLDHLTKKGRPR